MTSSTIAALASGRPPAAIAIIRISGPQAMASVAALTGTALPTPRRLALRTLRDSNGVWLDSALVVVFPGPQTASGEDLAELHLHGGVAVVSDVLAAVTALPGVRLAEPGEFTRRAFANGRIDLAQVEGLADLISAETSSQREQALALAGGSLSRAADMWRARCLDVLAQAEAGLDFAEDEADVAATLNEAAREELLGLAAELGVLIADSGRAQRIRDGLSIAVTGPPNSGKSSLVNALTRSDAAIVTPIAGTTRDAIEVQIDLGGVAAILVDTAGLRETTDPIEAEGIRRARARAATADLVLHVYDAVPPMRVESGATVVNKIDVAAIPSGHRNGIHFVSAVLGDGIAELRQWLAEWAATAVRRGEPVLLAHARHRSAFGDAAMALRDAASTDDPVLRAEGLRVAARAFGRIAGRVDVDDVLDRIFSQFCIGK
ncbi:MAG: tRNA uridine-5-carboxymethylaminomethyl(34) synthesis GTPase MnmE [Polymorphobacter sp.]